MFLFLTVFFCIVICAGVRMRSIAIGWWRLLEYELKHVLWRVKVAYLHRAVGCWIRDANG